MVYITTTHLQVLFHTQDIGVILHKDRNPMIFTLTRKFIGHIILAADKITSPSAPKRSPQEQDAVDEKTNNLMLYEMLACPFCVKVRREIKRLGLNIQKRDVKRNQEDMADLLNGGGKFQVPCLRIETDQQTSWLYESDDIVNYLRSLTKQA